MRCGEVWWVNFEPSVGEEIRKQRPAVIISNDAANKYLNRRGRLGAFQFGGSLMEVHQIEMGAFKMGCRGGSCTRLGHPQGVPLQPILNAPN
jgi:hypothetical protein